MCSSVCFIGHRPKNLFGWTDCDEYQHLTNTIKDVINNLINEGYTHFATGIRQGVDQIAFEAIQDIKQTNTSVKVSMYIFEIAPKSWHLEGKFNLETYYKLPRLADNTIVVKQQFGRDYYTQPYIDMIKISDVVIVVIDSDKESTTTKAALNFAIRNNKRIITINPVTLEVCELCA